MADILDILSPVESDESIIHREIHIHSPYTSTSYRNSEEFRIIIQSTDQIIDPSRSVVRFQGKITQPNDHPLITPGTSLVRNSILQAIAEARYEISAVEIDKNKNVGLTTVMKTLASFTPNHLKMLENAGWDPSKVIDANGNFDVIVPLSLIFGFAEDYRKVVVNVKHELIFVRSNNDTNVVIQTQAAANPPEVNGVAQPAHGYKVNFEKIEWLVPYLVLSDAQRANLLKQIEKDPIIAMNFRSWEMYEYPELPVATRHVWNVKTSTQLEKPRFVILGFQTSRNNVATANASNFDSCNIMNVKLFLNSQYYPYGNMNIDINNNRYAILYEMYCNFQSAYYGKNVAEPLMDKNEFKNSAPLIIIDCSRQNDTLKNGPVDVRLEFESRANFPAGTSAYCLILHDRMVHYKPISGDVRKIM